MNFSKSFRNTFLVILLSLIVSACATKKTTTTVEGQMQGDVSVSLYTSPSPRDKRQSRMPSSA